MSDTELRRLLEQLREADLHMHRCAWGSEQRALAAAKLEQIRRAVLAALSEAESLAAAS